MQQREQTSQQLSASIDGLKTAMLQHQQRLSELESVRVEFKRNRYDRAGSIFADEAVIPMLLREFLAGMLDSRMLWRVIREQQRYAPRRSDPGFGSGGFGRGTVWKGGLGDIGDIIGGIGRGGMGGGGGHPAVVDFGQAAVSELACGGALKRPFGKSSARLRCAGAALCRRESSRPMVRKVKSSMRFLPLRTFRGFI